MKRGRFWITIGHSPHHRRKSILLAQLNSTVLFLMDRVGVRNVARQMRSFDAQLEQALALLLDLVVFGFLELESPEFGLLSSCALWLRMLY